MAITDDESLLDILQTHGKVFLDSFQVPEDKKGKRRTLQGFSESSIKRAKRETANRSSPVDSAELEEEWTGFGSDTHIEDECESSPLPGEVKVLEASISVQKPNMIVFPGTGTKLSKNSTIAQGKAFMSSKVSKLSNRKLEHGKRHTIDEDDELTNAQNDALLHRLVHTQLLSGSLNPELNLTSAERKKALEGRILELAGSSKLGQGDKMVRAKERDKASKRVREGLLERQKQRREKLVQEAKEMGNYHPASKRLFQDPLEKNTRTSRVRGLRMGVGSFGGGVLRLSKGEIDRVQGGPTSDRVRGHRRNKR